MTARDVTYPYIAPPGLRTREPRHGVVIVGAGPVGLALALELANHGCACVIVDDSDRVSVGSRAICWSKRSLEIFDRLAIGDAVVAKGVTWQVGRTFHGDREVFNFDLLPEAGHKRPAFVNLQQYHVERLLIERALASDLIDLRWRNRVVAVDAVSGTVGIETPDGSYRLEADHVIACDGARSPLRSLLGLNFEGELFEERFLIADIEMQAEFPPERHFWFAPSFHPGQSALLHKQPDNIYRIDLQLGPDADPEREKDPARVTSRIEKVVGHGDFTLDWVSVYSFQCRRLARFVHDRVIFAGDAAHVVSPFGARGGNGGMQDIDNLGWKLAAVLRGDAGPELIASYDRERCAAADENLRHSSRATRFMTPKSATERRYRDAVLTLAGQTDFARPMVNSGRLSQPFDHRFRDAAPGLPAGASPGKVAPDAAFGDGWLLDALAGKTSLMAIGAHARDASVPVLSLPAAGDIAKRYLGDADQAYYLVRPDQVIAARWDHHAPDALRLALADMWEGRLCR